MRIRFVTQAEIQEREAAELARWRAMSWLERLGPCGSLAGVDAYESEPHIARERELSDALASLDAAKFHPEPR